MSRTETSVGLLKAIATIAGFAIILWSLGLPSLRFATAATVSSYSDTITDSAPNASANHNIQFTMPAENDGIGNGETIVLTFNGGFDLGTIGEKDIDVLFGGSNVAEANFSVATTSTTITITTVGTSTPAGTNIQVLIGTNATDGGPATAQIANPGTEGSYELDVAAGAGPADTGTTHIVVLNTVLVSASVDTVFTFAVSGVNAGVAISPTETTTGTSSTTTIPFGKLENGQATTSAQRLTVTTNASQGYIVTVQTDGYLESTTGGVIDGFSSESDTAITWSAPTGNVNDDTTWGHWGVTSDDATTSRASQFDADESTFIGASTTPRIVMEHDGPANGAVTGIGTTYVGYKVGITALQEAGEDYSTTLTYIATPTF